MRERLINKENFFIKTAGNFRRIKKLPAGLIEIPSNSSTSNYYMSEDETTLYRVSNHWALSECPFIASCSWVLKDTQGKKDFRKVRIGKILFKNLIDLEDSSISYREGYRSGRPVICQYGENLKTLEKVHRTRMATR